MNSMICGIQCVGGDVAFFSYLGILESKGLIRKIFPNMIYGTQAGVGMHAFS